mmetsp:Transcript_14010/g.16320  ORF Transcript_14010/g.16320 Transcript_14010/m.16320 type:complete len:86 (-) Transcript_14010:20-277(-)
MQGQHHGATHPRMISCHSLTSVLNTGLPCPDNCDSLHCPSPASRLEADPGKTLHGTFQNGLIFLAAVELSSKHGDIVQAWKHTSF